ncbi:hypothetical protein [Vibrio nigripulchritudo]|uniref:hypothetical protein n=1 Tax=Vibrio nigripulchritudo TaxID=28173 RepID=UPI002492616E|nr:hypothetical protein [Vibrio nigripulchritudo]BDU36921.1 hypothetical protein TUMSATVNIG2_13900 [Vibrio nigripulchritudo]BDU42631.1 hypothetical protein TUMSATVNIG3_14290 [Vibrio nigripulchritudo]
MSEEVMRHETGVSAHLEGDKITSHASNSKLRIFLIFLFFILSGYYLWVLYLIATPQVSLSYQTYYMDTRTLYWGRDKETFAIPESGMVNITEKSPLLTREGWRKKIVEGHRPLNSAGGLLFSSTPDKAERITISLSRDASELPRIDFYLNDVPLEPNYFRNKITLKFSMNQLNKENLNYLKIKPMESVNVQSVVFQ